jgi:hypothetical protein
MNLTKAQIAETLDKNVFTETQPRKTFETSFELIKQSLQKGETDFYGRYPLDQPIGSCQPSF